MKGLEEAMSRMKSVGNYKQDLEADPDGGEPNGLESVPRTHEAIFNNSRRSPHARYVWITKASMVDKNGNLGFPATNEEIRRFRDKARKVFLRKSPSMLQKSFAEAVMSWEEDHSARRPWKRREADRGGTRDHFLEERDLRPKRLQGMCALDGSSSDQGRAERGSGTGGRNPEDSNQVQGSHRQGGGGDNRWAQLRLQEQEGKRQVTTAPKPIEL
jgi:hypothetical protein